jgi:hypothetical protein
MRFRVEKLERLFALLLVGLLANQLAVWSAHTHADQGWPGPAPSVAVSMEGPTGTGGAEHAAQDCELCRSRAEVERQATDSSRAEAPLATICGRHSRPAETPVFPGHSALALPVRGPPSIA